MEPMGELLAQDLQRLLNIRRGKAVAPTRIAPKAVPQMLDLPSSSVGIPEHQLSKNGSICVLECEFKAGTLRMADFA